MHFFSPAGKKSAGKTSNHACPNIPFLLDLNKYFQFSNSSTMQNYCTLIEDYNYIYTGCFKIKRSNFANILQVEIRKRCYVNISPEMFYYYITLRKKTS